MAAAREGRPQGEPAVRPAAPHPRPVAAGEEREDQTALQARLLAADEETFREVYECYAPLVHGVAARLTRDRAAAEDVTQEVFSFLWERPFAFDPSRGTLRTWLSVLAHHRAVDWIRREEKRRALTVPQSAPHHGDETADAAADALRAHRVRAAAAQLPDTLRRPLLLAYYGGRTYRQVATELGIPEGTAKTRLRAALRALAAALAEEEGAAP
ncbi:sigma-70 family RNA polymerase sigma factor [Streptomyces sp. ODS28]|uniref:sigma-70 family RNA polymerase sigma factor n=1 Tax=Streptomyces sp. ODS28 TaxID=3136688 RepID=UPI0031EF8FC0